VLAPGTDIGAYRIDGLLGRGGMGVVYEATQHSLGRKVALKLLATDLSLDESFRERFRREGRIQAGMDHAHIVPIYEAGEIEHHGLFIAMRLVRGATLKDLVKRGELDGERTLRILKPVADALDTAHEADLVHRDIKPQNILVGRRDHAYLADFGLTRAPGDTAYTKTGQFVGTLDYIAPEQIRGEQAGNASDLYSFAAVAFECLTGVVPFAKPSEAAVLFAHMSDPPPRASDLRPDLPAPVDDVLAAGLAKLPSERP
jgi:serine/threonine-protein kinase